MSLHDELGAPADLAALYTAGALAPAELARFEAHLASGCAACEVELARLGPALAALVVAADPIAPDPRTKDALLRRIEAASSCSPLRESFQAGVEASDAIVINRAADAVWKDSDIEGIRIRLLHVDPARNQFTALVRMEPGRSYPRHLHNGPEECLVLEGELVVGELLLRAGDYQRMPAGSRHGIQRTERGCLLLITSSLTDEFI
jgi:quercetin dioxygenase-like cupin family protein